MSATITEQAPLIGKEIENDPALIKQLQEILDQCPSDIKHMEVDGAKIEIL